MNNILRDKTNVGILVVKIFAIIFVLQFLFGGGIRGLQAPPVKEQKAYIIKELNNFDIEGALKPNGKLDHLDSRDNLAYGSKSFTWLGDKEDVIKKIVEIAQRNGWKKEDSKRPDYIFVKGEYRLYISVYDEKQKGIGIDIQYIR